MNFLRKNFLIYPQFQLTLIITQFLVMGGVIGLVALQITRSYERLKALGAQAGLSEGHAYFNLLNYQEDLVKSYLFAALFLGWGVSFVTSLLLSHKLAGPLVRLKRHFETMFQTGQPASIQFRRTDFMRDLPPAINNAVYRLAGKQNPAAGVEQIDKKKSA